MRSAVAVVLCSLAGCTFSTSGVDVVADDAPVPDATPIDGTVGDPDAGCTPGCDGDTLVTCSGTTPVETACVLGCGLAGGPHCQEMIPSNLNGTGDLDDVTGSIHIPAAKVTVMTDTGEITLGDGTIIRAAGPSIGGTRYRQIDAATAVLAVDQLEIDPGVALYAFGNRALIILASGPVLIQGHLDFSAGCDLGGAGFTARCGGPGGGDGGSSIAVAGTGCAPGAGGVNGSNETGGAGGGNASMGGNGGTGNGTPLASPITSCSGATLIPLAGGSGGGAGAPSGSSVGGGGGGALQISSMTSITIGANASLERPTFYLSGAGGGGNTTANKGGGGGGAGGGLLLEAPTVTMFDLVVIAGGGGGGGGRTTGQSGVWAPEDGNPAAGGLGDPDGAGGTGGTPTAVAAPGGGNVDGTGGGGGGFGRLRINTASGVFTTPGGALISATSSVGPVARD